MKMKDHNLHLETLLNRDLIQFDISQIKLFIDNKIILITGGGGSIGSELCRQLCKLQPKKIILLGRGENSIFNIYSELKQYHHIIKPLIADIRCASRINHIMKKYSPEVVFHTAAHKHVPLMESNLVEAVDNNIMGTYSLLQNSIENKVAHFVAISSDKAVKPLSVMGATKRVCEFLVAYMAKKYNVSYVCVRFGNILNSRGSVVRTFNQQIENDDVLTITHPDMERYFMTTTEAVSLVLQASTIKKGNTFILDMGKPIKILDLAKRLAVLRGVDERNVKIKFTGIRPGEKLQESLRYNDEHSSHTEYHKILCVNQENFSFTNLEQKICSLVYSIKQENEKEILSFLQSLIPEFRKIRR